MRLSETHLRHLAKIRKCGDFPDDSSTLRFCISFTKAVLNIIPAAVAENYIAAHSFSESNGAGPEDPEDPEVSIPLEYGSTTALYTLCKPPGSNI